MLSAINLFQIIEILDAKLILPQTSKAIALQEILADKKLCSMLKNSTICGVKIDSRLLETSDLFVALKGDRVDGHDFISNLAQDVFALVAKIQTSLAVQFLVADTSKSLAKLATFVRSKFAKPTIGITGNSGKTSVKDLTKLLLQEKYITGATAGNFNNHLGLPLTLLNFSPKTQIAVLEIGANHLNEIAQLATIAQPNIGIITNVTGAHLGEFGSFANIAQAKSEILQNLTKEDLAILPLDDKYYDFWHNCNKQTKQISFSLKNKNADIFVTHLEKSIQNCKFKVKINCKTLNIFDESPELTINALGEHQVINSLPAIMVALYFNLTWQEITKGLQNFTSSQGRMQPLAGIKSSIIIDDSYNANAGSVKAAIDFLTSQIDKTKILVLGDIKELNQFGEQIHRDLGKYARKSGVDYLFTCGELAKFAALEFGQNAFSFSDKNQLLQSLQTDLPSNSILLIKASRSMQFEEIVQGLKA